MPPVSLPPRAARGQVWTERSATRVISSGPPAHPPTPPLPPTGGEGGAGGPSVLQPPSRPLQRDAQHVGRLRAEAVLVRLVAAQEVVAPEAAGDGILDGPRDQDDAGRQSAGRRVEAGGVEAHRAAERQ